jgi:hypothetical protein
LEYPSRNHLGGCLSSSFGHSGQVLVKHVDDTNGLISPALLSNKNLAKGLEVTLMPKAVGKTLNSSNFFLWFVSFVDASFCWFHQQLF